MIAGKATVGDGVHAFSRQLAQFVFNALHRFYMHDPMPAEWHSDKSLDILLAPIGNQPACAFVFTHAFRFLQFLNHLVTEFAFQVGVFQTGQYPICGLHHFTGISVQFLDIQLPGKSGNRISGKLIPCSDDRRMNSFLKVLIKQHLSILRNHLVRHYVFNPENVPDIEFTAVLGYNIKSQSEHWFFH